MRNLKISSIIIILVVVMGLAGCAKLIPDASDYATPTPYPTRTPIPVATATPTSTVTPTPTDTVTPTPTPTATNTPTPTWTPIPTPTNTPTPTPTDTPTPTPTPTPDPVKEVNDYVWTTKKANLRADADANSQLLTTVPANTKVQRIGIHENKWSKVKLGGYVGYIGPNSVTTVEPTPTPVPTATPTPEPVQLNSHGAVYGDPDSVGWSRNLFYDHPEIWNLERSYQYYIYYYVNGKEIFTIINAIRSLDGTYARFCGPNAPDECYFTTSYDFVVGKMIHRDPGDPEVCEWTDPDDGHTYKFTADTFVQLKLVDGTYVEITVDEYLAHPFGYDKK